MNFIMIIGIIIIAAIIIWGIYSQVILKSWTWKKRIILLAVAFIGMGIVQYGDNIRKSTFNKEQLAFMQENKKFSSFTDEDRNLYYRSLMTFEKSKPEIYEKYYNQFLEWGMDNYADMNKHRDLSREEIKGYVEKDMASRRKSK
ncbi:hypothetical protein [Sebaldella sp. S0638]|uniref:hypothetical protein n=1 Tax=Sebaldella sp. S0638 TaxID=2957809 RepID=UPI00209F038B|nr:hypothetical protein [Sebaldella sp. S0638]MCP1224261.1 hypothetical protein [Sebaldella sp. S0638]